MVLKQNKKQMELKNHVRDVLKEEFPSDIPLMEKEIEGLSHKLGVAPDLLANELFCSTDYSIRRSIGFIGERLVDKYGEEKANVRLALGILKVLDRATKGKSEKVDETLRILGVEHYKVLPFQRFFRSAIDTDEFNDFLDRERSHLRIVGRHGFEVKSIEELILSDETNPREEEVYYIRRDMDGIFFQGISSKPQPLRKKLEEFVEKPDKDTIKPLIDEIASRLNIREESGLDIGFDELLYVFLTGLAISGNLPDVDPKIIRHFVSMYENDVIRKSVNPDIREMYDFEGILHLHSAPYSSGIAEIAGPDLETAKKEYPFYLLKYGMDTNTSSLSVYDGEKVYGLSTMKHPKEFQRKFFDVHDYPHLSFGREGDDLVIGVSTHSGIMTAGTLDPKELYLEWNFSIDEKAVAIHFERDFIRGRYFYAISAKNSFIYVAPQVLDDIYDRLVKKRQ